MVTVGSEAGAPAAKIAELSDIVQEPVSDIKRVKKS
jgi:hypothetical protein